MLGSTALDDVRGAAVDAQGNLYLTGATAGALGDGASPAGDLDLFVAKVSADGEQRSIRQLGTAARDEARAVIVDAAGSVYAGGTSGSAFLGNAHAGNHDALVLKLDATSF